MSKIKIISDSTADIRYESIEKYGIKVLPINLYFGDEQYRDYFDIKFEEFYKKLAGEKEIPKTSQISPTVFYDAYKEAADEGFDTVLCFTLSKVGSGTYNNANLAANMLHDDGISLDVEVVDTMSYCFMYGRAVEIAAEMAENDTEKQEILDRVYSFLSGQAAILAVDDIKYLKSGGRVKPSVATVASILDIKPILSIEDGLVEYIDKVRGSKKVIPKLISITEERGIKDAEEIWIVYADVPKKAEELKKALEENLGVTVNGISYIGPTVGINVGCGSMAVIFYRKPE